MSSTRNINAPPAFAENALTVIPPTPVAGVPYRDPIAGPQSSADGWPYGERVNSAEWNQLVYQWSSLLQILDKNGILGWTDLNDYTSAAVCFGSDGEVYSWVQASGPNNGGAKDPVSNPAFWSPTFSGQLIGVQRFTANGTYTPTPGTRSIIVEAVGGGGAGGGAVATIAGQYSVGGGGGSGAYSKGRLTSGFAGASVVVGAAGAALSGATGGAGGTSSFGALITATGGLGGLSQGNGAAAVVAYGGGGATLGATGNIGNAGGTTGGYGVFVPSGALFPIGGVGASSFFGGGGFGSSALDGGPGLAPGAGGGGSSNIPSSAARPGGLGAAGIVIVWEYR